MARSYSDKFLLALNKNKADSLGVRLGRLCVKANLPAAYVAVALGVSPITVYSWFRGQGISESRRRSVDTLITMLTHDLEDKLLPVRNVGDAKKYIENLAGVKI